MPYLISGKQSKKNNRISVASLCLLTCLLFFFKSPISFSQTVYTESFPFSFEYKYKKDKTRTRDGLVNVTVQYGKRGGEFGFIKSPGQNVDFSDISDKIIQVQIFQLKLDNKGKDNAPKHPLVVDTKRTGVGAGIQQLELKKATVFEYLEDSSPAKSRMEFKVVDNGSVNLVIPFGLISEEIAFERWTFDEGEIRIKFNVKGIVKEVEEAPPPIVEANPDKEFWEENKNGIIGWLAYIGEYPTGKYYSDAIQRIENYDEQNWRTAKGEETLAGYENYVSLASTYPKYAKYVSDANQRIASINGANAEQAKERTAWKEAQKENTIPAYRTYLGAYPDGLYKKQANENIHLLIPMELVVKDLGNGRSRVTIKNGVNPRYKNVSLDYGLKIDDSDLRRDSVLMVSYLTGGRYKIVVVDDFGKKDSVTFDNQLEANMGINRRDSSKMVFSIKKGIKPYKIDLIHATANTLAWSKDSIFTEKVEIPISDWQEAQLGGNYNVEVWDSKSWKPVKIASALSVPELPRRWETPFIIAGVLGALVFLTGIFFLVKMFLDRRQKTYQYN